MTETPAFTLRNNLARIVSDPVAPTMAKLDPNEARNWATMHRLKLTFQSWNYFLVLETDVRGNAQGFDNLDTAISSVYDALPDNARGDPYMVLFNNDGDSLEVDEIRTGGHPLDEDTLKTMLVSAEIVALVPKEDEAKAA